MFGISRIPVVISLAVAFDGLSPVVIVVPLMFNDRLNVPDSADVHTSCVALLMRDPTICPPLRSDELHDSVLSPVP